MEGKHTFDLIKEFRSTSNKILIDYGKFRKWLQTAVKKRADLKKQQARPGILTKLESGDYQEAKSRLDASLKHGTLTEDLLSSVRDIINGSLAPNSPDGRRPERS